MVAFIKSINESIDDWINDSDYKELIIWYLDSEKQTIASLQNALEKKDYSTLSYLADMVYGHGGSFGFMFISNIGKAIELAAKSQDDVQIAALISKLSDYVGFLSSVK